MGYLSQDSIWMCSLANTGVPNYLIEFAGKSMLGYGEGGSWCNMNPAGDNQGVLQVIAQWESALKLGSHKELAFQQWLYYLEEPCFVNISAKTDLTSTFNIKHVDSWPTKFPLCIVKLLFSFGLVPVISWWDGPCVIPCHGQTLSGLSTRLFDRDLGYYLDQQTLYDHI